MMREQTHKCLSLQQSPADAQTRCNALVSVEQNVQTRVQHGSGRSAAEHAQWQSPGQPAAAFGEWLDSAALRSVLHFVEADAVPGHGGPAAATRFLKDRTTRLTQPCGGIAPMRTQPCSISWCAAGSSQCKGGLNSSRRPGDLPAARQPPAVAPAHHPGRPPGGCAAAARPHEGGGGGGIRCKSRC